MIEIERYRKTQAVDISSPACSMDHPQSAVPCSSIKPIEIVILPLYGATPLNVLGLAEVFTEANVHMASAPPYVVRVATKSGRGYGALFSPALITDIPYNELAENVDTLLIVGGLESPLREDSHDLVDWLGSRCKRARRFGGFGSGSLLLAEAGLLERKRATIHWSWSTEFTKRHPAIELLSDHIYVQDGNCYTSAGASSAVDLALTLVEQDLGGDITLAIAKRLILVSRRFGAQPQLSATLMAQTGRCSVIQNLILWMAENIQEDLSVPTLARRVAMSQRNFARQFLREVGKPPGRHVIDIRLEVAKAHLAEGKMTLKEISAASGLGSTEVYAGSS